MSILDTITVEDFKNYFYRDFSFATDQSDYTKIVDADIEKAFGEAYASFNEDLFSTQDEKNMVFLYLTAFYLVLDIKNSTAGLNSSFNGIVSSKSVDNVSESYYIPEWMKNNPLYSTYMTNGYGMKYLNLLYPRLVGNIFISKGATTID